MKTVCNEYALLTVTLLTVTLLTVTLPTVTLLTVTLLTVTLLTVTLLSVKKHIFSLLADIAYACSVSCRNVAITTRLKNFSNIDLDEFPEFAMSRPVYATINAGDMLYMPTYWWHEVRLGHREIRPM